MDMCTTLQCSWPLPLDEALLGSDETNTIDLCGTAKVFRLSRASWPNDN
jgi:hypothetical protein